MRAIATALVMLALADPRAAAADELRFVTCPVYRDTDAGRKSGCWLADEPTTGVLYDVTQSPTKPDWNRAILVEGIVAPRQDGACGGMTLDPVRVSILDSPCVRHMLPAEGFSGRTFVLPPRNVRPLSEPRPQPATPYRDRTFHVLFDFGRSFIVYQLSDFLIDQAVTYAKAVEARRVLVTGFAATRPVVVSGHELVEAPSLARARAELVAEWFRRAGIPADRIEVRWQGDAEVAPVEAADGLLEPSRRRVDIEVRVR
jgi:outer membrane protein OmpA-like peptidoglycan-associated protein